MNCPHHHRIFAAEPRSYRDLPLRLAEYGCCYRYEQSGELFGLMRVRSLNMNDAHIYCTEEQFADEFRAVNDMYLKYFKIFGLEKYQMRFSTHVAGRAGQEIRQRTGAVEEDRGHGAPGVDRIRHQLRGGGERGGVLRPED
jgi:threonyl-tRNA synthetase